MQGSSSEEATYPDSLITVPFPWEKARRLNECSILQFASGMKIIKAKCPQVTKGSVILPFPQEFSAKRGETKGKRNGGKKGGEVGEDE